MSPDIVVTTLDAARLSRVLERFSAPFYAPLTALLLDELRRAARVEPDEISPVVVTMNSTVRFRLDDEIDTRDATLVYPGREDRLFGKISVLTPVGSALLGAHEGETIGWKGFDGRRRRVTVVKVLYQPEAHGIDFGEEQAESSKYGCFPA